MSSSYLEKYGLGLISNGYKIVPIKHGSKAPIGIRGWTQIIADQNQLAQWIKQGFEGVGVLCKNHPAIDIDIMDEEVSNRMLAKVREMLPGAPMRVGKHPKKLLLYKTEKPFKKIRSATYKDSLGNENAVEILGDGQQCVAYAEHPDTQSPYSWHGDGNGSPPGIFEIKAASLPSIILDDARAVVAEFEKIAYEKVATGEWEKIEYGTEGSQTENEGAEDHGCFENLRPPLGLSDQDIQKALASIAKPEYYAYEKWIRVGMALWHQTNGSEEGFEYWLQWSEQDPNFKSEEDLRSRWPGFRSDHTRRCTTFATVLRWASKERMGENPLQEFKERFVYIMDGDSVHDLEGFGHDKLPLLKEFKNMYANVRMEIQVPRPVQGNPDRTVPKMVPVHSQWMIDPERISAHGSIYVPGGPEILFDLEDRRWINSFHMPVFANPCPMVIQNGETKMDEEYVESQLKIFFQHMEYIIPVEEEREWFYSWMAFNIQRPHIRCKVTPLLIAIDHGTGRGWIVQLMNLLLGLWNCSKTKMSTLSGESNAGAYQDFMNETLFCAVEEIKDADKPYGVLDSVRSYLTENRLEINLKYGVKETKDVYTNFLWNSNHADALVLKAEDRRVNVFKTVDGPKDNAYYDRLYGWLEVEDKANEGINIQEQTVDGEESIESGGEVYDRAGVRVSAGVACLFHWLKKRDLDKFNWQKSMHNKARQELIENKQTNIEYLFFELVKNPPYEFMTLAEIAVELNIQRENSIDDSFCLNESETKQIKKMAQQHLGKQERVKISHEPEPEGDGWVTLDTTYEVHYWSLDKKKTFSAKEMREIYYARKKW